MALLLVLHLSMISVVHAGKVAKQNLDPRADDWVTDIELSKPISLPSTLSLFRMPPLSTIKDKLGTGKPLSLQLKLSISLQGRKQNLVSLLYNDVPLQELRVPSVNDGVLPYDLQDSILPVNRESDNILAVFYKMSDDSCTSKEYVAREVVYYGVTTKYYVPTTVTTSAETLAANCDTMFKEKKPIKHKVANLGFDHSQTMGWTTSAPQRDPTPLTRVLARDVQRADEVEKRFSNSFSLRTRLFTRGSRETRIAATVLYNGSPLHELRVPSLDNERDEATTVPGDLVNAILPVQPQGDERVKVFYLMKDNSCTWRQYDLQVGTENSPSVRGYVPITQTVSAVDQQLCKKLFSSTSIKVAKESFKETEDDWETAFVLGGPTPIPRVLARDVQTYKDVDIVADQSFSLKAKVHVSAQGQKRLALMVMYKEYILHEVTVALDDNQKDVATVTGDLVNSILPVKPKNDNRVKVFYWLDDGSCTWREYQYHEEFYNSVKAKYYLPSTASPAQEVSQAVCKKLFEPNSVVPDLPSHKVDVPVDFTSGGRKGFFQRYFHFSSS